MQPNFEKAARGIIKELKESSLKNLSRPPKNIIICGTDLGADIDDECFLCICLLLHRWNVCKLLLVVTNREWKKERAKSAINIIKDMGDLKIPVAYGTEGSEDHKPLHTYVRREGNHNNKIPTGKSALYKALLELQEKGESCDVAVFSSFRDLSEVMQEHGDLVRQTVANFYFQGDWAKSMDNQQFQTLVPEMQSTNNQWYPQATHYAHYWLRQESIPTFTATRFSAGKAAVDKTAVVEAAKKDHKVAAYIYESWVSQEKKFFDQANEKDPKKRFRPRMDIEWYVKRHPRWTKAKGEALPGQFSDMLPYIDMTLYDVVAGLPCLLKDQSCFDKLFQPHQQKLRMGKREVLHHIIGRSPETPDVNGGLLSELMLQLLQKSFTETMGN